jgi:hypothetical protein
MEICFLQKMYTFYIIRNEQIVESANETDIWCLNPWLEKLVHFTIINIQREQIDDSEKRPCHDILIGFGLWAL